MSYDGLYTGVIARNLNNELKGARIERIMQPEDDELVIQLSTATKRRNLLLSACASGARVQFTEIKRENPEEAPAFCMLLRKHLQGAFIREVRQTDTERIIEIYIECLDELGRSAPKILIAETMGRHSNIVFVDEESLKIIDCIKRIPIYTNRVRQLLPGLYYQYPPAQDKADFWTADFSALSSVDEVQGLCPSAKDSLKLGDLEKLRKDLLAGQYKAYVYLDSDKKPKDVHILPLTSLSGMEEMSFDDPHQALDYYYQNRMDSNRVMQRADNLARTVKGVLDKQLLKKQRLLEELKQAEESDIYRLKAELLTANIHLAKPGDKFIDVISYYDNSKVRIDLDERYSAAKNAQNYYKKYAKLKSSAKEKKIQLEDCEKDIEYLESVIDLIPLCKSYEEIELYQKELADQGLLRIRTASKRNKAVKPKPRKFKSSDGFDIIVGRNNIENDYISFKLGTKTDYWFHTKDIHGSHVLLLTEGAEPTETSLLEAAGTAAYFSKGKDSDKVPVDYVPLRYVKKPAGAKPGMVIFTNNRTVWIHPRNPEEQN